MTYQPGDKVRYKTSHARVRVYIFVRYFFRTDHLCVLERDDGQHINAYVNRLIPFLGTNQAAVHLLEKED